jgi:hypothetical protein
MKTSATAEPTNQVMIVHSNSWNLANSGATLTATVVATPPTDVKLFYEISRWKTQGGLPKEQIAKKDISAVRSVDWLMILIRQAMNICTGVDIATWKNGLGTSAHRNSDELTVTTPSSTRAWTINLYSHYLIWDSPALSTE